MAAFGPKRLKEGAVTSLSQLEAALASLGCVLSLHHADRTWWATATVGDTSRACSGDTLVDAVNEALRWANGRRGHA
jgi:hypothetical protein